MLKKIGDLTEKMLYILDTSQKRWGLVIFALSFIGALVETIGVSAILPLVQIIIEPEELMKNAVVVQITQNIGINNSNELLIFIVIGVICIYILKNAYLLFLTYVRTKYSCKIQRELSVKMMRYYMQRDYLFFVQHNSSELVRGINATPSSIYQVLSGVLSLVSEILTVISICIFIMIADIKMASVMLVLIIICLVFILFVFKSMTRRYGKKYHQYYAKVTKASLQAFQGIKEVLVMNRQEYFVRKYEEAYVEQQKSVVGKTIASDSPGYLIEAICVVGLLSYVCIQCLLVENAKVLVPTIASFAIGAFRILPALGRISSRINTIIFYLPAVQEMYANFVETEQYKNELDNQIVSEPEENLTFTGGITIQGLEWKYPNSEKAVLNNINMTIKKGESVAFIGHSGAGKTTLADILLGLLIPEHGGVFVDGKNILQSREQWGKIIGFVSQAFYLNDDTIRNNVAFGIDERKIDDEKVWKALEQAQLKEFVESLDKKLSTRVGERGVRFSGGQRQRIAIARALYESPEILILDEATAALDNDTETAVMEAVENLKGKMTLIIIAHRLSTIRNCDKVYEVKDGILCERDKEEVLNRDK